MTSTAEPLVVRLAKVMAAVGHVPKRGYNQFHRYEYALEADIVDAVRSELASRGVMMLPSVRDLSWREIETGKGKQQIATLTVAFRFICDGDDGNQELEVIGVGEGQDAGDKAVYKAMTGALKYCLLKTFLIPTGDDPERDDAPAKPPAPRPSAKPVPPKPEARAEAITLSPAGEMLLDALRNAPSAAVALRPYYLGWKDRLTEAHAVVLAAYCRARKNIADGKEAEAGMTESELEDYLHAKEVLMAAE